MKSTKTIQDVELTYTRTDLPVIQIRNGYQSAELARKTIPKSQILLREFFGILLLSRSNRVLHRSLLYSGGQHSVIVDPAMIVQCALLANATGVILFHNHPSGNMQPSEHDMRLTTKVIECCRLFEISVLDHVIVSGFEDVTPNFYSFVDEGKL